MNDPTAPFDAGNADTAPRPSAWVPHKPEQRLSIVVRRFLRRALVPPFYAVANHDADGVARTEAARSRDKDRGIEPGQLDWEVEQGPPHLFRRVELKRGDNDTRPSQDVTIVKLIEVGAPPITAWTLREVYEGLRGAGFRFQGNVETTLQLMERQLEALDRRADARKNGTIAPKPARKRKVEPRFTAGKRQARNLRGKGIFF